MLPVVSGTVGRAGAVLALARSATTFRIIGFPGRISGIFLRCESRRGEKHADCGCATEYDLFHNDVSFIVN